MYFQKTLYLFMTVCIFLTTGSPKEELASYTEEIILKELGRFAVVKEKFVQANLNISVTLSFSKADEDRVLKRDSIQFQSIVAKYNPKGPQLPEEYNKTSKNSAFELAKKLNITVVGSRERFEENGVLENKIVVAEGIKIDYKDGNTLVIINDEESDLEPDADEDLKEYMDVMKEFALPIEMEKLLFDGSGNVIKTERQTYEPKKVRIDSAESMSVDMQMKVAEALKRACVLKETGKDRVLLLCRYLGIQFPEYTFQAVIGDGSHYFSSDVSVKLIFEDDVYHIWGVANETEEDSDSD